MHKKILTILFFVLFAAPQTVWLWGPVPSFAQSAQTNIDSIPFAPAVNYGAGTHPRSVFCADLDGDGDLDLAVANRESNNVSILKNNGDGTFQTKVDYGAGHHPYSVFCADLDGDGDLDLAVANYSSNKVSILKNNGDGTFQAKVNYGAGSHPYSVFCADLDGDDDLDLAVANSNSNTVSILENNGDGTFQAKVDYSAGPDPYSVFCADLDGDFDLDLAVANYQSNNVSILKNNGDGTFQAKVDYATGSHPRSVFCADLDGDGDLDLAVANSNSNTVSILKNNGDGTFQAKVDYSAGPDPYSVFCADLDGDSDFDLAVTNFESDKGSILKNNEDRDLDLTVANPCSYKVSILKNNGDGTFQAKFDYGAGSHPYSVFCADLDEDGDMDLAVANGGSNNVSILENLTQIPANQPPWAFHLLFPFDEDTTQQVVNFDWQSAYDPNLGDQIKYDLYISTTPGFEPNNTTIDSNLLVSKHTDTLEIGTYYWKVKAKDNWGAFRWSSETYRFFNSNYLTDTLIVVAFSPVDLIVTDPKGDSIGIDFNTIPDATYDTTQDYNNDGDKDDIVTIPNRLVGDYLIEVVPEPGDSGVYDLGIRVDGSNVMNLATDQPSPPSDEADTFSYNVPWYEEGDANGDWKLDATDVVYLINYLFLCMPAPDPLEAGDANCDGVVDASDVLYLINYLFLGGPPPCS